MKNQLKRSNEKKIKQGDIILTPNNEIYMIIGGYIDGEDFYALVNLYSGEMLPSTLSTLKELADGLIDKNDIVFDKDEVIITNK